MILSERSQTIILWWSLIFMVVFAVDFYAVLGMVPPPPASLSPAEVASFYAGNASHIRIGAVIASWCSAFFIPLSIVMAFQIRRLEEGQPVWSSMVMVGGVMTSIFLVMPPIFWGVAAFSPSRPPENTALINEIANLMLVTTDQFFVFMYVAIVYVGLKAKPDPMSAFPRWFSWFSLYVTIIAEVGAMGYLFKTGPFSWNGLFVFWLPFGIFFIWMATAYYCLFRALKLQSAAIHG